MSNAHRAAFDANGYVVVPGLFPPDELAELRRHIDGVLDGSIRPQLPAREPPADFNIQWEPRVRDDAFVPRREKVRVVFHMAHTHPYFRSVATSARVLDLIEQLIGPDIRYYTDQMFVKPAHHGSDVPFHQDSGYWPAAEPRLLTCWIAVDDSTEANGCVRVIPGTHRSPIPHKHFKNHPTQQWGLIDDQLDVSKEIPVELKAGSVMVHHSLLVHRSFPNRSDRPRRGWALIYLPADLKFTSPWNFQYGFQLVRGRARRKAGAVAAVPAE